MPDRSTPPPARPRLLPEGRAARIALLLLVLFALTRSIVWASTQPGWFAPDEDYHWSYTEYVVNEGSVPDLDRPFATSELFQAVKEVRQREYRRHARRQFIGDPKRTLAGLAAIPSGARRATGERPRAVLHPPLYYTGTVAADLAAGDASAPTRLTLMRYWSALLGALLVYLSWLLAAQVLSRTWAQMAAAALVATQPMVGFTSSIVGNDILVACGFAAVLAWLCFMLRTVPRARQGLGLGALLAVALLSKSSSLVLLPIAALALGMMWLAEPGHRQELRRACGAATAVVAVIAGPWYVYLVISTGSLVGAKGNVLAQVPDALAQGGALATPLAALPLAALAPSDAYSWFEETYITYWYHQFPRDVAGFDPWRLLPIAAGAFALAGVLTYLSRHRRLLEPGAATARQLVVLIATPVALTLPFFAADMVRAGKGLDFLVADGRLMRPGYCAAAVLCVFGISHLLRAAKRQTAPIAIGGLVLLSFANYWQTWWTWDIRRYYGDGDPRAVLYKASFDKPEWVTSNTLLAGLILALLLFATAYLLVARSTNWSKERSTSAA